MTFFIKKLVRRPELIFRPFQIIKRVKWIFSKNTKTKKVALPWGMKINACPRDRIGSSILKTGTYDTVLLECLSRLINPGEIGLDIGANHGLMTSLMAKSSGPKGEVIAFEVPAAVRKRLLSGMDEISLTLQRSDEIAAHEQGLAQRHPWI